MYQNLSESYGYVNKKQIHKRDYSKDIHTENWLENAIDLDVYVGSMNSDVKYVTELLFEELSDLIAVKKSKHRSKEALKLILLNLWIALYVDMPVKYSRNKNDYRQHKRYGLLYFKYSRIVSTIDALESLGYVHQYEGYYNREKNFGRQTRCYATRKLIALFFSNNLTQPGFITKQEPGEIIQFKDKEKILRDYPETELTQGMRSNLENYNSFIKQQNIKVHLVRNTKINSQFLNQLNANALKWVISPCKIKLKNPYPNQIFFGGSGSNFRPDADNQFIRDDDKENKTTFMFNVWMSTITKVFRKIESNSLKKLQKIYYLGWAGIDHLIFKINYESLHRVFNNSSFKQGGRFYGAYRLGLPKTIRSQIKINGADTVELDYSSLHIRMLYHLEGIDYRDDPYAILCESKKERKMYKLLQLISINAKNEKKAVKAIRDEFRKEGIDHPLNDLSIRNLLSKFKEAHRQIVKYLHSGVGLKLQNKDSIITESILLSLMNENIPCLPVHDSFIVPEQHEYLLYEKMMDSYKAVMNFEPVIG